MRYIFFLSCTCYNVCRWLSCGTETCSGAEHLCVIGFCWECAHFLYVVLQVGNQGVTPLVFVLSFPNMFLYGTALGRVNQTDQQPVAKLCCWCGPSEKLQSLIATVMCVEAKLTATSEEVDGYVSDKQKSWSVISEPTLLRKRFSAYWAHKTFKTETLEIRADTSTPSTPIAKKYSSLLGSSWNRSRYRAGQTEKVNGVGSWAESQLTVLFQTFMAAQSIASPCTTW